ncbi:ABC transporter ATP-binding protein [Mycoplasmopsis adleri]|uniref:ABC transporter ATP-binding protein n=1 Tax=Mycoplasmopsis adleri TaxID=51362 RepID=UPI003872B590
MNLMPKKIKFFGIFAILLSITQPFINMIIPTITKQLITFLASTSNEDVTIFILKQEWTIGSFPRNQALGIIVGLTFAVASLLVITSYLSVYLTTKTKIYASYNLRKILFNHVLTLSRKNIDKITQSTLITRFGNDINKIEDGFFIICRSMFISPFFVIWGLTFALITNPWLSISIAVIIPFIIGAAILAIFKLFPLYRKENWLLDQLNEVAKEDFNAVSLVKSYNLEDNQYKRFEQASFNVNSTARKAAKYDSIAWPLIDLIVLVGNIILFSIVAIIIKKYNGGESAFTKKLVGDIYQFSTYMNMISMGVYTTLFTLNRLFRSNVSAKRIQEILNTKTDIDYVVSDTKIESGKIEFQHVTFKYDNRVILNDINLTINPGETIGIIGKTGSGKSTLAHLIAREYKLNDNDGQILIDNENIYKIDTKDFYKKIGIVFQKPSLISGTIKSNVAFGSENYEDQALEKALRLSCSDFVFDLEDKYQSSINARGLNLSGGQRQRLSIAQALLKDRKILILDDSTSALDNKTDQQVRKNILNHNHERTVLVISQRIKSIIDSDKIIVLDKGQIVGIGKHDELVKTNKIYQEIYTAQESEDE